MFPLITFVDWRKEHFEETSVAFQLEFTLRKKHHFANGVHLVWYTQRTLHYFSYFSYKVDGFQLSVKTFFIIKYQQFIIKVHILNTIEQERLST